MKMILRAAPQRPQRIPSGRAARIWTSPVNAASTPPYPRDHNLTARRRIVALFSAYSQTSRAGRPEDILWELIKNGWANYSPGTRLQYANYVIDSFDRHSAANAQPILKCCQEAFALVPTLGGARLVDDPLLAVSADSDVGWKSIFWFLAATGCHPRDMWNVSRQDFVFQTTALRVSWRIRKTHCDRASIVEDALYLYAWSCPHHRR